MKPVQRAGRQASMTTTRSNPTDVERRDDLDGAAPN
jgi:hypothetical protein